MARHVAWCGVVIVAQHGTWEKLGNGRLAFIFQLSQVLIKNGEAQPSLNKTIADLALTQMSKLSKHLGVTDYADYRSNVTTTMYCSEIVKSGVLHAQCPIQKFIISQHFLYHSTSYPPHYVRSVEGQLCLHYTSS